MDYWLAVLDEVIDQTGVEFSDDQKIVAADLIKSAASVHGEYSHHQEPAPAPPKAIVPERKSAWWEDVSQLSGSDWVLANQIHALIGSRYG